MLVRRTLKDDKGQAMVEFGLTIGVFLLFCYGLLAIGLWATTAFIAQEAAHSVAREYAGTGDQSVAIREGNNFLNHWAYPFAKSHTITIDTDGDVCTATVTVVPKDGIRKMFVLEMPSMTKESSATMAYALRYQYQFIGN